MADTVVKTVEDVDRLFSQIVVNGETFNSERYVPPAPVQVIEEPESQQTTPSQSQTPSVPSGQTTQGEDVYGVVLNDEQHDFVDPDVAELIPPGTSTTNMLVNQSGIHDAVDTAVENAIADLDVSQAGGNGKYIKAISETNGKISATEGTIADTVESGNSNPVTSNAVSQAISGASGDIQQEIQNAINDLDVNAVGGDGNYIATIGESNGKIYATAKTIATSVESGNNNPVSSDAVNSALAGVSGDVTQEIADAIGALDVASTGGSGKFIQSISETDGKISAVEGTIDNMVTQNSSNPVTGGAVKTAIDNAISSVYKPAGDKAVAQLTSALLVARNLGNVYNITDSGTTTSDFVEGAGHPIKAGDNVAVVDVGTSSNPSYKFDLIGGFIDLSNYIQKSQTSGLVKNDGSIDTTAYAKQSEMSVTPGTGANADKTTIQLKTGTSATVLTQHTPAGTASPNMDGTASPGSAGSYSRSDHVHPKDTSKADKVVNATSGNFAGLDSNGNITDSGKKASDFLPSDTPIPPAITVDSALSTTSTNPVQNKVINTALAGKVGTSRTVNGHALSANVTVTKSDIGLGNVDNTADSAKAVASAGKLTTARRVYVKLGTASTSETKDFSGETAIPVDGALEIANGGTGKTTALSAQSNLLSNMNAVTSDVRDTSGLVFKYATPSDSTGAVCSRQASYLAKYLNTRIAGRPNLTCSTEGATVAKTVALAGFVLSKGAQLIITFSDANTVATPTLNVNSTGAKEIRINRTTVSTDSSSGNYLKASTAYYAHYDGSYWQLDTYQVPLARYSASSASATDCTYPYSKFDVYCDTAAGTAAKVGRCRGFALYTGAIISLRVAVANTIASPTLNVQGSGAKSIRVNGAMVSSGSQLSAGLYIGYYDGTYWQLIKTNAPTLTVDSFFSPDVAFSYTEAGTGAKTAVMPSYKLVPGARFRLYIVNTNSFLSPTLSVNGTTEKSIKVNGVAVSASNLTAGWYEVMYDGTSYNLYSNTNIVIPVTAGGTGAEDASSALTNLGAVGKGNSCVHEFRSSSSSSNDGYITITFKSGFYPSGVLLLTTNSGNIISFDLYNISANNFKPWSRYDLGSTTGLTGYATTGHAIYLRIRRGYVNSIIIPDIKMSEVGNISYDGIKVNISDISQEAPSGITFKTDVKHYEGKSVYYGTCSTSRDTNAKVVTCPDFVLETGCKIVVKFTDTAGSAPTSGNITLNINSTGAKSVYNKDNTQMTYAYSGEFRANRYCEFTYDGSRFIWLNYNSNTTYSTITQAEITAGTSTDSRLVTPKLLGDNFIKKTDLLDMMYPVGSLYWSSNSTDPGTLFGGTWTQIKDRFVWAKGDSDNVNATGGEKTHTLTVAEMPSHTHTFTGSAVTSGGSSATNTGAENSHTHSYSHSHEYTPAGKIASTSGGTDNKTAGMSANSTGYTNPIARTVDASVTNSGNIKWTDGGYGSWSKSGTGTQILVGGKLSVDVAHTHTAYFTGTKGETTSQSKTTTGEGSSHSHTMAHTHSVTASGTNANTGSGTAHNNMPPYIVKYCWERTA